MVVPGPRRQAFLLAFVLLAGGLKVLTYDAPPGIDRADLAAVADAAAARRTARLSTRGEVSLNGTSIRMTGSGAVAFGPRTAALHLSMPGAVSRYGVLPEYDYAVAPPRGYLRGAGQPYWMTFDAPSDIVAAAPDPFTILHLMSVVRPIRRTGGATVGGVACDHYRADPRYGTGPDVPMRLDVWVDAQGLPRRVTWSRPVGEATFRLVLDLSDYGRPVHVEVPDSGDDVTSIGAALRGIGFPA